MLDFITLLVNVIAIMVMLEYMTDNDSPHNTRMFAIVGYVLIMARFYLEII